MAASATKTKVAVVQGPGGFVIEVHKIVFDSDATVELSTGLKRVWDFVPGAHGSGGNAATLSLDETLNGNNEWIVPSTGLLTVDATGNTTDTWFVTLFGY